MKKIKKSENNEQTILMNVQNDFLLAPFYSRNIIYLAQIMISLYSNKNEILHFRKIQ